MGMATPPIFQQDIHARWARTDDIFYRYARGTRVENVDQYGPAAAHNQSY